MGLKKRHSAKNVTLFMGKGRGDHELIKNAGREGEGEKEEDGEEHND